jgi:hypothetical protein
MTVRSTCAAVAFAAAVAVSGPFTSARAADGNIAIDLNKSEPADGGCRFYFEVANGTDLDFSVFSGEFVFFDRSGVMAANMLLSFGRLQPNKRHFQRFTFPALACDGIGRVLINDVRECRHAGPADFDCTAALAVSHKGEIILEK